MTAAVLVRLAIGPRRLPGTHQVHGLAAVQRLVLRLLFHARHNGLHLGDKNQGLWKARSFHPMRRRLNARHTRCTSELDRPRASAMPREIQCRASGGMLSNVQTIPTSIAASSIVSGVPGRGSSRSHPYGNRQHASTTSRRCSAQFLDQWRLFILLADRAAQHNPRPAM